MKHGRPREPWPTGVIIALVICGTILALALMDTIEGLLHS